MIAYGGLNQLCVDWGGGVTQTDTDITDSNPWTKIKAVPKSIISGFTRHFSLTHIYIRIGTIGTLSYTLRGLFYVTCNAL